MAVRLLSPRPNSTRPHRTARSRQPPITQIDRSPPTSEHEGGPHLEIGRARRGRVSVSRLRGQVCRIKSSRPDHDNQTSPIPCFGPHPWSRWPKNGDLNCVEAPPRNARGARADPRHGDALAPCPRYRRSPRTAGTAARARRVLGRCGSGLADLRTRFCRPGGGNSRALPPRPVLRSSTRNSPLIATAHPRASALSLGWSQTSLGPCAPQPDPTSRSTRRCRETPGWAMGSRAAGSLTVASWSRRRSTVRRLRSLTACRIASMAAMYPATVGTGEVHTGRGCAFGKCAYAPNASPRGRHGDDRQARRTRRCGRSPRTCT